MELLWAPSLRLPSRVTRFYVITTKQGVGMKVRCQFVLLKKSGRWLIDNKKIWRGDWESTIL